MNDFSTQTSHCIDNGSLPYTNILRNRREIRREIQRDVDKGTTGEDTRSVPDKNINRDNNNTDNYSQMESRTTKTDDSNADARRKSKSVKLEIYYDKILGKGSFAKVYVAKYKGKLVAVKIVDIKNAREKLIRQFKRELDIIRILKNNPHPNIPKYYKIIEDRKNYRIIIVMEWCRGGELTNFIKSGLDYVQIKYYFSQIISGYIHLLNLNIIHRDMKSQNIMLSYNLETIKIIDFGLSKVINTDMTRTVVGSPAYMAPERLGAQDYDSTSDIWSLGIILYEMIYRINPFKSCKNKAMLIKSANVPIDLPKTRQCSEIQTIASEKGAGELKDVIIRKTEPVPAEIIEFMSGMLHIDPVERYDWEDISQTDVMTLDVPDNLKLERVLQFYRDARQNTITRSNGGDDSNSCDGSQDESLVEQQMFDMDLDGKTNLDKDNNNSDVLDKESYSDLLDRSDGRKSPDHPEQSEAIPIPSRGKTVIEGSSPIFMAESICNVAGASVEDKQLECLEEYFMLNDPGIFSLYEDPGDYVAKRVKARDSGFIDVTFLDNTPFLQESYDIGDPSPYKVLKDGSTQIGSMIYSKSAPVMTGISKVAKKTANALGNIISPP